MDNVIILVCVDVATLFTQCRIVNSKKSAEVWGAFVDCWVSPCGAPVNLIMDAGGEFRPINWAVSSADIGIKTEYKAKGSHAFVVEGGNKVARASLNKLRHSHGDWDGDRLVLEVVKVVNNLIGEHGFSPNQCVFGTGKSDQYEPKMPSGVEDEVFALDASFGGAFF